MALSIGRSIRTGFQAANRSWAAIALYGASWIVVGVVMLVLGIAALSLTNPPAVLFEPPRATVPPAPAVDAPPAPAASPAPETDVFSQLESQPADASLAETVAPEAKAPEVTPPAPEPAERALTGAQIDERNRAIREWVGRAWPLFVLAIVLIMLVSTWLQAGQISYVAKQVAGQPVRVTEIWTAGRRAFGRLIGATLLGMLGVVGVALVLALIGMLGSGLAQVLPGWLVAVLGTLVILALVAGMVWIVVRLLFWFVLIVAEGQGPLDALRSSLRLTGGSATWPLLGLCLVMFVISIGVLLPLGLFEGIGNSLGGGAGTALALFGNLLGGVANLYLGFLFLAVVVQAYRDLKASDLAHPA